MRARHAAALLVAVLLAAIVFGGFFWRPWHDPPPAPPLPPQHIALRVLITAGSFSFASARVAERLAELHGVPVVFLLPESAAQTEAAATEQIGALERAGVRVELAGLCGDGALRALEQAGAFSHVLLFVTEEDSVAALLCASRAFRILRSASIVLVTPSIEAVQEWVGVEPGDARPAARLAWAARAWLTLLAAEHGASTAVVQVDGLVYGPGVDRRHLLGRWAAAAAAHPPVPVALLDSASTVAARVVFVDDLADAVAAFVREDRSSGPPAVRIPGQPVPALRLLELLELELGYVVPRAVAAAEPFPAWRTGSLLDDAEVQHLRRVERVLAPAPPVEVDIGMRRLARWYELFAQQQRELAQLRAERQALGQGNAPQELLSPAGQFLFELQAKQQQDISARKSRFVAARNNATRAALLAKRQEWDRHQANPAFPLSKEFRFRERRDALGGDLLFQPGASVDELKDLCRAIPECAGFNTLGYVKHAIPRDGDAGWTAMSPDARATDGLYVVSNVWPCRTGYAACGEHATCTDGASPHEPYICRCLPGFVGTPPGCIPTDPATVIDMLDTLDAPHFGSRPPFVFFPLLDSPFGDLLVAGSDLSVDQLREVCWSIPRCLGFNTNGMLKGDIQPASAWYQWTTDPTAGIYVLDVNYCEMRGELCARGASCQRVDAAKYECQCDRKGWSVQTVAKPLPFSASNETVDVQECGPPASGSETLARAGLPVLPVLPAIASGGKASEAIHVVMCADAEQLPGLCAAVLSLRATASPATLQRLVVHVLHPAGLALPRALAGLVRGVPFDADAVVGREYAVHSDVGVVGNLASAANFVRFFMDQLLLPDNPGMVGQQRKKKKKKRK